MKIATSLAAFLTFAMPVAGQAAETLTLLTDQTQLLALSGTPATVVVGNPSIADVTIQGNEVFLHGKAFGTTNIIIMDAAGTRMADFEVTVMKGGSHDVAVYKAGSRYSYVCAPDCEATFHVGDTIRVHQTIKEGDKSRIQIFEGIVMLELVADPAAYVGKTVAFPREVPPGPADYSR